MKSPQHRDAAALGLCGCVEGMIVAGAIPAHSVDYVMRFVAALRSSQGLRPWSPPVANDNTSIAELDRILDEMEAGLVHA